MGRAEGNYVFAGEVLVSKIGAAIAVFITMPIWYFLLYTLLKAANVDRLCWFLFWVYIPFSLFAMAAIKTAEGKK